MRVESSGIVKGVLLDKYGKRGVREEGTGMPILSFPLEILEAPEGTKSYAIIFDDPDSNPVCGFTWIHWLVISDKSSISENASVTDDDLIQGVNSWGKSVYGGMAPPDRPHTYVVTVFALDYVPNLKAGFTIDDMYSAMENHVLDKAVTTGLYDN